MIETKATAKTTRSRNLDILKLVNLFEKRQRDWFAHSKRIFLSFFPATAGYSKTTTCLSTTYLNLLFSGLSDIRFLISRYEFGDNYCSKNFCQYAADMKMYQRYIVDIADNICKFMAINLHNISLMTDCYSSSSIKPVHQLRHCWMCRESQGLIQVYGWPKARQELS